MAATVEGAFMLLDRATPVLRKMRLEAAKTDVYIKSLGESLDKVGTNKQLGQWTKAADQIRSLGSEFDSTGRKVRKTGEEVKRADNFFGRFMTRVDSGLNRLRSRLRPFEGALRGAAGGLGAVIGGLGGMATAFPPIITLLAVATPAIIAFGGAIAALAVSLGAAVGGAMAVGGGLLGSLAVGIGTIAAVVKPAMERTKEYTKAQENLNKALKAGDTRKIRQAQQEVNRLAKATPGVARLANATKGLGERWKELSRPAQSEFFKLASSAIESLRGLMGLFAREANLNLRSVRTAFERYLAPYFRSRGFRDLIRNLSTIFRMNVGGFARSISHLGGAFSNILNVFGSTAGNVGNNFSKLMSRFEKWTQSGTGVRALATMREALSGVAHLIGSVVQLFVRLMVTQNGKKNGTSVFEQWADAIDKFRESLTDKKIANFFDRSIRDASKWLGMMVDFVKAIVPPLTAIGNAFGKVVDAVGGKGLAAILGAYVGYKGVRGGQSMARTFSGGVSNMLKERGSNPGNPVWVRDAVGAGKGPGSTPVGGGPGGGGKSPGRIGRYFGPAAVSASRALGTLGAGLTVGMLVGGGGSKLAPAGTTAGNFQRHVVQGPAGQTPLPPMSQQVQQLGRTASLGRSPAASGIFGQVQNLAAKATKAVGVETRKTRTNTTRDYTALNKNATKQMRDMASSVGDAARRTSQVIATQSRAAYSSASANFRALYTEMLGYLRKIGVNPGSSGTPTTAATTAGVGATASGTVGTTGGAGGGTSTSPTGLARGGRIAGRGLQDTVPVGHNTIAAPGELIVNRHTENRVNRLLANQGTNLGREVEREGRPHSAPIAPMGGIMAGLSHGGRVRYFKKGGRTTAAAVGDLFGNAAQKTSGNVLSGGSGAVGNLTAMIAQANEIASHNYPYVWGGGHASFAGPYDCSGAVSAVLHAGGVLAAPVVSGALANMYEPGPGAVTIYANPTHTYMSMNGRFFGTSTQNPGGGANWFNGGPRPGFTVRHVNVGGTGGGVTVSAGGGAVAVPTLKRRRARGAGNFGLAARGATQRVQNAAQQRLNAAYGATGGGTSGVSTTGAAGGGGLMGATTFGGPLDPGTGTVGYKGDNLLQHPDSYAELNMGSAMGGLPYMTPAKVTANGRSATLYKRDIGAGGGPVGGQPRKIDLWYQAAEALGLPQSWSGAVNVQVGQKAAKGGRIPWFGEGTDMIARRPTIIGVGDKGEERVTVTPTRKSGKGGGVRIENMTIQNHRKGDIKRQVKEEVAAAFNELADELDLAPMEDDEEVVGL